MKTTLLATPILAAHSVTLSLLFLGAALAAPGQESKDKKPEEAKEPERSIFRDKNLEEAVRHYVFEKRNSDKPITEKDVENISTINAKGRDIADLTGLEKCRSLASLDLARNKITSLDPIRDLPRLQYLNLADNLIDNLAPLASNPALQYIELSRNRVKNLEPLRGLTNLASLYLSRNQISDIEPLMHYPKISSLYLDHNQIRSIEGVGNLKTLWTLSLSDNAIEDIAPLQGLTGLYHLFLDNNIISNLRPLVVMGRNDTEKRFIPFINIYLSGNPLSPAALEKQVPRLKKFGARIHR